MNMHGLLKTQYRLFLLLAVTYMLPFLQSVGMGSVSGQLKSALELNSDGIGLLGGAYLAGYAFVQVFSGIIAMYYGPKKTLSVLLLVSVAGGVIFCSSSSLGAAAAGRAVSAVGMAAVMTSSFVLFSRWFPPSSFPRVCSLFFSIGGLGALLATAPFSALSRAVGWRVTYGILATWTLISALLILLRIRDWPAANAASHVLPPQNLKQPSLRDIWTGICHVAEHMDFWKLCAWYFGISSLYYAYGGLWCGLYMADVHNMGIVQIGGVLFMGGLGLVLGAPLLAFLTERFLKSYRLALALGGLLGLLSLGWLFWHIDTISLGGLYLVMLGIGMGANAPSAMGYAAARSLFGSEMSGVIGGIFGFANFVGGAFLQVLVGVLLQFFSGGDKPSAHAYLLAFIPLAVCCALGMVCAFRVTESYGKENVLADNTAPAQN